MKTKVTVRFIKHGSYFSMQYRLLPIRSIVFSFVFVVSFSYRRWRYQRATLLRLPSESAAHEMSFYA